MAELRIGQIVAEQYRVLKRLGSGGFSHVYLVDSLLLPGQMQALKLLKLEGTRTDEWRTRFEREVRILSALRHPNIIGIRHFFVAGDSLAYTMDYVDGISLKELLRREPITMRRALERVRDVLEALQVAHEHDPPIVHRDIKPQNVMITAVGTDREKALLLDFGVAKLLEAGGPALTRGFIGSAPWGSPEQWQNRAIDGRSDIYSMGCMLFQLVSGQFPFQAQSVDQMAVKHLHDEAPLLSQVIPRPIPGAVDELCARALAKTPAKRFPTARAMACAIDAALKVEGLDVPGVWRYAGAAPAGGARVTGAETPSGTEELPRTVVVPPPPGSIDARSRPSPAAVGAPGFEHTQTVASPTAGRAAPTAGDAAATSAPGLEPTGPWPPPDALSASLQEQTIAPGLGAACVHLPAGSAVRRLFLFAGEAITFGRSPNRAGQTAHAILRVLPCTSAEATPEAWARSMRISNDHGSIGMVGPQLAIGDTSSRGTRVDGAPLHRSRRIVGAPRCDLVIGQDALHLRAEIFQDRAAGSAEACALLLWRVDNAPEHVYVAVARSITIGAGFGVGVRLRHPGGGGVRIANRGGTLVCETLLPDSRHERGGAELAAGQTLLAGDQLVFGEQVGVVQLPTLADYTTL